jgi:hypothetical protein
MRRRHPVFLAARVLTGLITVTPVNHDELDRFIEAKAAEDESAALRDLADPAARESRGLSDPSVGPAGIEGFEDEGVPFRAGRFNALSGAFIARLGANESLAKHLIARGYSEARGAIRLQRAGFAAKLTAAVAHRYAPDAHASAAASTRSGSFGQTSCAESPPK